MNPVAMALLGAGEFDPWSEPVERWLLARSRTPKGPVLIAPTAAAHEGDGSFDGWATKGLQHYEAMGVPAWLSPVARATDRSGWPAHNRRSSAPVYPDAPMMPTRIIARAYEPSHVSARWLASARRARYSAVSTGSTSRT